MNKKNKKTVTIVGGGPAGLFCARLLLDQGHEVQLFDQSSGVGKKFLVAGHGGLNLTHSEALDKFASRYGKDSEFFKELLEDFSPTDLRDFCHSLGVETFVGSSGRVFPTKMKAGEILLSWLGELKKHKNFHLRPKHKLIDLNKNGEIKFMGPEGEVAFTADKIILALGGASWPKTGSDGSWTSILEGLGARVSPLRPMNCGFNIQWSEHFKKRVERFPLKNINLVFGEDVSKAEAMVTDYGIEGGGVYALSGKLRDRIELDGFAKLSVDLKPNLEEATIANKLAKKPNKTSWSNYLRKSLNLNSDHALLLREVASKEEFESPEKLAKTIKGLPLKLESPTPIAEAISSSGGVCFQSLDKFLQLKSAPGIYITGEMLDFEAPTGGYLLQACFSTAYRVSSALK